MSEIIKFTDVDVDGCGTNIDVLVQVEGEPLTNGSVDRIKDAIAEFKKENSEDWDTDGCITVAIEQLEKDGYKVDYLIPSVEIDF